MRYLLAPLAGALLAIPLLASACGSSTAVAPATAPVEAAWPLRLAKPSRPRIPG